MPAWSQLRKLARMADWATISALATAGGTLALAGVTLASVRSANRAARVAEQYHLKGFIGTHALGHTRMATESDVDIRSAHPYWAYPFADVSVVHNGQLTNYWNGRRALERRGLNPASGPALVTGAAAKGTWVRILRPAIEGRLVRGFEGADIGHRLAAGSERDIDIVFTGLRPGEKLSEDLLGRGEVDDRPHHPLIRPVPVAPLTPDRVSGLDPDTADLRHVLARAAGCGTADSSRSGMLPGPTERPRQAQPLAG